MTRTLDEIWTAINKICNRMTALETKYDAHVQTQKSKKEKRANTIATIATAVAILTLIASYFKQ